MKTVIEDFALMAPNTVHLTVDCIENFHATGRAIWTHFKKLTFLRVGILSAISDQHDFPGIDSGFTGYCKRILRELEVKSKDGKGQESESGPEQEPKVTPCSASKIETKEKDIPRKHPSILDLPGNYLNF